MLELLAELLEQQPERGHNHHEAPDSGHLVTAEKVVHVAHQPFGNFVHVDALVRDPL